MKKETPKKKAVQRNRKLTHQEWFRLAEWIRHNLDRLLKNHPGLTYTLLAQICNKEAGCKNSVSAYSAGQICKELGRPLSSRGSNNNPDLLKRLAELEARIEAIEDVLEDQL